MVTGIKGITSDELLQAQAQIQDEISGDVNPLPLSNPIYYPN